MERVKFLDSLKLRVKNIYFWIGILGFIANFLNAASIDISTLSSWAILWDSVVAVFKNPFMLFSCVSMLLGIYVDGSTPGITDKK